MRRLADYPTVPIRLGFIVIALTAAMAVSIPIATASSLSSSAGGLFPHQQTLRSGGIGRHLRTSLSIPPSYTLNSGYIKVTTSSGKKLAMGLMAQPGKPAQSGIPAQPATVQVGLTTLASLTAITSFQAHSWKFSPPPSTVAISNNNVHVVLTTAQIGAFGGGLDLHFTHQAGTAQKCQTGSETIYKGTLTGSIDFNTKTKNESSKWGSVQQSISDPQASFDVDRGCIPKSPPPPPTPQCAKTFYWSSPAQAVPGGTETFGGINGIVGGKGTHWLFASRNVKLTGLPKGTTGSRDDAVLDTGPTQTLSESTVTTSGKKTYPLKITVKPSASPSAYTSGGATLTSTSSKTTDSGPCKHGSTMETSTITYSVGTYDWVNAASPLKGKQAVGRPISVPDSSTVTSNAGIFASGYHP